MKYIILFALKCLIVILIATGLLIALLTSGEPTTATNEQIYSRLFLAVKLMVLGGIGEVIFNKLRRVVL